MEGRCNSTRALTTLVGLATVFGMASTAAAQDAINFGKDKSELGHMARTLDQAIEWGATYDLDQDAVADLGMRGVIDPIMCVTAVDCAQPGDFTIFINASFFDAAEIMEFAQNGDLTEICSSFAFAGGACAAAPGDPMFLALWTWNFFPVDAAGIPSAGTVATFDTEFPLANLAVEALFAGTVAGFPVLNMKFDLGDTDGAGGPGTAIGLPVEAGACLALMPKYALAGCSAFWETSSNMDGSASGDGLSLQDALMDGFDACDYTANDLLLCLDILTTQPPSCTLAVETGAPSNDDCTGAATFPIVCGPGTVVISQCLLFATLDTANDPLLPCALGEPDDFTGEPTVFYSFTPTGTRALLSLCRVSDGMGAGGGNAPFPNGDFLLAVYVEADMPGEGEGPCNLVQIACSEDTCEGNKPVLCLNDLDPMVTYIVEIAGHDDFDGIAIELDVTCDAMDIPPVPVNDACVDATPLVFDGGVPNAAFGSGNTLCASLDGIAGGCDGTANGNSPGVWFSAIGDGFTWSISQCTLGGGTYDSQINVYCGDCSTGLICIAGNDDSTECAPQSSLTFCTEVGRPYLIFVHGFFDVGLFEIEVISDPDFTFMMCVNEIPQDDLCVLFELDCQALSPDFTEGTSAQGLFEVCGTDVNSGCGIDPLSGTAFIQDGMTALSLPFSACGEINAENNLRDLDTYRFSVESRSVLTITMLAEFNSEMFLFDSDDCATNLVVVNPTGVAGTDLTLNVVVNAGTYLLLATSDDFSGVPCGVNNDYNISMSATPLGRCCIVGDAPPMFDDCCITDEATCTDLGGVFDAGGDCSPITYTATVEMAAVPFNSIIGLANEIVVDGGDGDGLIGDEAAQFIDLSGADSDLIVTGGGVGELPFKFFGELRDDVAVVSNGYLAFPNGGVVILDFTPDPIPMAGSVGTLNDHLAGLWTDLDGSVTGAVSAVLLGSAPFRSLVVEYNALPIFDQPGTVNTFQIILFEGTNCVRYLYNDIELPVITDPLMAPEYVIGVENQDGTAGTALDEMTIEGLDTSALSATEALQVEFCPEAELEAHEACKVSVGLCVGDCDGNGTVDFSDLVAMLFEFGQPAPAEACNADLSGDGLVNFSDLVATLFLFGPCP